MNRGSRAATVSPEPAVVVRDLRVRRGGRTVFDGLDLEVARGGVTGLMGPSGCGKTTLMRTVVGTQRVRSGRVTVLGEQAGTPALRHRVAYDTQAASVYSDLTVEQNLRYFARLTGASRSDVGRVLDQVNLRDQASRRVDALSGGQASRVSLGVAILGRPELVVLDEPTVGLDPLLREELWEVFRSLTAEGATLVVSSHVMDEALRCDRLLLMRDGRLVADTTPERLLSETRTSDPDRAFLALIEGGAG
ncbi:ABC transporter ATP-binding protein [Nocardiopsis sp. NPDC006938]|uniref:ABC transporter ATP-binding protein n=1 Tax=Nocardiopsis sp. NPDC006938 TaxID=3364337 RepID=UPI0036CF5941